MEIGIPYELIHPDGTRLVFGIAGKADLDYIGPLEPDQGIAGLDSPDLREVAQEIVQGHGGLHLEFFHGRRPIVINAEIDRNVEIATTMQREQRVKRATNATAANALLKWTNSGGFPKRRLALRRQPGLRITGRRPKTLLIPMVDSDWRVVSDVENATAATPIGAVLAQVAAVNAGDVVASPRLQVVGTDGGITGNVTLRNVTAGAEIQFKPAFGVPAGQTLVVNLSPPWPTITLNGADVYGQIDFLPTTWWGLVPGNNVIQLQADVGDATLQVFWRDAWI